VEEAMQAHQGEVALRVAEQTGSLNAQVQRLEAELAEAQRAEDQLRHRRIEAVSTLAGGMAHELNNVLGPVLMAAQLLRKQVSGKSRTLVDSVEASAQRGADIVKQVLTFARGFHGERAPVSPEMLVREVVQSLQDTFPRNVRVSSEVADDLLLISADASQLHRVLLNLAVNARDAMPSGGTLKFSVGNVTVDEKFISSRRATNARPGNYVLFRVADSGVGIPRDILPRIFEPFFTTKEPGQSVGLGLATALGVVQSHGGFILVETEEDKGTEFQIYLPAAGAETSARTPQVELPRGNGELVMLADDEQGVLEVTAEILEWHGYKVLKARDGEQALALYEQHAADIKAVITDILMPFMDGVEL
ncbi:MAG: response regulator, partial [Verrucomicrobia bacterium]|nr:response regulator [Verrucomicrobiota bacterium]